MFTGLIEKVCIVASVEPKAGSMILRVDLGSLADDVKPGDSIAVSGVCLTVSKLQGNTTSFDVSKETLIKSTLGGLKQSSAVNIERALKADGRFGGHFVLGHIDGTAIIKSVNRHGDFADFTFTADNELLSAIVKKGSVAVDGISLTVSDIYKNSFTVAVIPETLNRTTLSKAKNGDKVNIETDIIIKSVKQRLEEILPKNRALTAEKLKEMGF